MAKRKVVQISHWTSCQNRKSQTVAKPALNSRYKDEIGCDGIRGNILSG